MKAFPAVEEVRAAFQGKLRFVYRHVPKSRADGFSKQAAEVSGFAGAHGKFWPMYRELFTHEGRHDLEHLVEYATAIGLDAVECRAALAEHRYAAREGARRRGHPQRHHRDADLLHQRRALRESARGSSP